MANWAGDAIFWLHPQGHPGEFTQLGPSAESCRFEWWLQEFFAPLQQAILQLSFTSKRISPEKNGVRIATSKTSVAAVRGPRRAVWQK